MGADTKIAWCDHSLNISWGCEKISPGCANCLSPDTDILMSDWTTKRLSDVSVGDKVMAFPENEEKKFTVATVEKKWHTRKEAVRLTVEGASSPITGSLDHKYLSAVGRTNWLLPTSMRPGVTKLRTIPISKRIEVGHAFMSGYVSAVVDVSGTKREKLTGAEYRESAWYVRFVSKSEEFLGRLQNFIHSIFRVTIPIRDFDAGKGVMSRKIETRRADLVTKLTSIKHEESREFLAGYLAGAFDIRGTYGNVPRIGSIRISCVSKAIREKLKKVASILGYEFIAEKTRFMVRLKGSVAVKAKFLAEMNTLDTSLREIGINSMIASNRSKVTGYELVGPTDLIDIQTSTGTFIANGVLTHNCYAENVADKGRMAYRDVSGNPVIVWGKNRPRRVFGEKYWAQPLKWNREAQAEGVRKRVFCSSMTDVFLDDPYVIPELKKLWPLIKATPWLDWMLLTKRSNRIALSLPEDWSPTEYPNVWLGVSIENADYVHRAIDLRKIECVVRFISYEPALGPLDTLDLTGIDLVLYGGESGNGTANYRKEDKQWARDIHARCYANGTTFFHKQSAAVRTETGIELDGRIIRQWPNPRFPDGVTVPGFVFREDPLIEPQPGPVELFA